MFSRLHLEVLVVSAADTTRSLRFPSVKENVKFNIQISHILLLEWRVWRVFHAIL